MQDHHSTVWSSTGREPPPRMTLLRDHALSWLEHGGVVQCCGVIHWAAPSLGSMQCVVCMGHAAWPLGGLRAGEQRKT